jgi:hypothetical protein
MTSTEGRAEDLGVRSGWCALDCSVTGTAHQRRGRPNQDSSRLWWSEPPPSRRVLIAIADGLGSCKHPRSGRGSQLACMAAERGVAEVISGLDILGSPEQTLPAVLTRVGEELGRRVVSHWRALVGEEPEPPGPELPAGEGTDAAASAATDTNRAGLYASTLVFALMTEHCCVFFQLGDGDLRVVDGDGQQRIVLPSDPLLLGTSTTHLALPEAWRHTRVVAVPTEAFRPRMVVVATDGLSTSFSEATVGMQHFVEDLADEVSKKEPTERIRARLGGVLSRYSSEGSGDDITVAAAWRCPGEPVAADDVPPLPPRSDTTTS